MELIRTKLHRPSVFGDIVSRSRLHALMDRGLLVPLTLVSAPAGYGKTVLVSHWADSLQHPCAWISLDESDGELRQFIDYLAAALDGQLPGACPATAAVSGAGKLPPVSALATRLINELDGLDAPFVLVLDDYHRIAPTSPVHLLLSQVLEHPPRHLHVVVIGRRDPPLALWAMRAASMLNEVRLRELCFKDEEVAELLGTTSATTFAPEVIAHLQKEVEGWPVGLRLAALALRQVTEPSVFLDCLRGGIPHAQDYLLHEVLAGQPRELRQCLLRSSILERFCPELIVTVCLSDPPSASAPGSAHEVVDWLLRSDLFTVSLDASGEWFRFHHLLQKLLREQLAQVATERDIAALHLRASAWFESNGLITEAIEHALAADDGPLAADLVERYAQKEFASDHWYVVDRWLSLLPIDIRRERPLLLLAEAWVRNLQHQLRRALPLIDEAQALLSAAGSSGTTVPTATGLIGWLYGYVAYSEGQGKRSVQYLEEAVASLAETGSAFFDDAQMFLALAQCMVGRHDEAVASLQASLDETDPSQAYRFSRLLGGLTFAHLLSGDLHAAHTQAQRLAFLASANDMRLNKAWSHHLLGCTRLHTGDLEEAMEHFEHAVEMRYLLEPMAATNAMAGLALARQLSGFDDEAARACDELRVFAQELNAAEHLAVARSCQARIGLLRGEAASARRWAFSVDLQPAPHTLFLWLEVPQLTAARILIDGGTREGLERASELLNAVRDRGAECRFHCHVIEVAVLEAVALERQGRHDDAAAAAASAISLARPGGWTRPFLEAGAQLTAQLERLRQQGDEDAFIDRILGAPANPRPGLVTNPQETRVRSERAVAIPPPDVGPLTNRELDILELLVRRLRSKEIADRLCISTHTVNSHVKHIYRKLGVSSRRQAAERASEAGLVDTR